MFNKEKKISKQTWVSATFLLIFSSVISKAFGFVREILIARNFGISSQVDAYLVAISIPSLIGGTIGSAFSVAIVPLYHKLTGRGDEEKAAKFLKQVFTFTIVVSLVLMAIVFLMPQTILHAIAPELSPDTLQLAANILRWLSVLLLGYSMFNVLSAVYNAIHHFKIPVITDMFSNLFIIAAIVLLTSSIGIYSLVVGMNVSYYFVISIFLIHLFFHKMIGFNFDFKSEEFKIFLKFIAPVIVFMFFIQINSMVENYFASSLQKGSIASLGYARRLYDIIPTLLIANVAKAVFPTFSTLYAEKQIESLRDLVIKLNKQFIIYFLPITFIVIFFRREIIAIVFMRGAFDAEALNLTSNAFMYYSGGLVATTMIPVFFRLCYAFSDSVSPLIAVLGSTLTLVIGNYILAPLMGISGIALTGSLASIVCLFLLGWLVRKKIGGIDLKNLFKSIAIAVACSLAALTPIYFFPVANPYYIFALGPLYILIYLSLGLLISRQEFSIVWLILRRTVLPKNKV